MAGRGDWGIIKAARPLAGSVTRQHQASEQTEALAGARGAAQPLLAPPGDQAR
jgi:hypothetical protein